MYVCICHALTDHDVKSAETKGATDEKEVFCLYGVNPQCGRCIPFMRGILNSPEKDAQVCFEHGAENRRCGKTG